MSQRSPEEWREFAEMQRERAEGDEFAGNTLVLGIVLCIAIAACVVFLNGSAEEPIEKEKTEQSQ